MSPLHVVGPGGGTVVTALGSTCRTQTDGAEVSAAYSLMEEEFWGETTPLHTHVAAEESFYVLSGEVQAWVSGEVVAAGPGSFLVVPRGAPHGLRRLSIEPVRMLTVISPPGVEQFFAEVVRQGEDALLDDPERLVALAAEHGTEVLGDYPA